MFSWLSRAFRVFYGVHRFSGKLQESIGGVSEALLGVLRRFISFQAKLFKASRSFKGFQVSFRVRRSKGCSRVSGCLTGFLLNFKGVSESIKWASTSFKTFPKYQGLQMLLEGFRRDPSGLKSGFKAFHGDFRRFLRDFRRALRRYRRVIPIDSISFSQGNSFNAQIVIELTTCLIDRCYLRLSE